MRQRIVDSLPGLDLTRLRGKTAVPPDALAEASRALAALEGREAGNPFYYWLRGELLRRTDGTDAGEPFFARAAEAAGAKSVVHWILWQEHLARGLWKEAERHEQALVPLQLRAGLATAPLLGDTLVEAARHAGLDGDLPAAFRLYDRALLYDPRHVEALAGRAASRWGLSPGRVAGALSDAARSVSASLGDRLTAGRMLGNLLLSFMAAWLLCLLICAGVAALRTHAVFFHDLQEGLFRRFLPPARWSLSLLVLLAPLFLGLGLLWTAVAALLLLAPYLAPRERLLASILLAGLALMPLGYRWIAAQHRLAASPRLHASLAAERGGVGEDLLAALEAWRADHPNSGLAAYYLGVVQKRRGDLAAAEQSLAAAVKLRPSWSFAQTGLGNLHALAGRQAEAEAAYLKATSLRESFAAAANLGALYTVQMQLEKSAEWMRRSAQADGHAAGLLARAAARGGTAAMLEEPVPAAVLAAELGTEDEGDAIAEGFWGGPLRGISLRWLPAVALALLAAFWAQARLRSARAAARCQECGTPFCTQCHPNFRERTYCGPCTPVFRERDGIPAMAKVARFREADAWSRRERKRTAWLAALIPGGGWWYRGAGLALPVSLLALGALLEGMVLDAAAPSLRFPSPYPWTVRWGGALAIVLLLQGLSVWQGRRAAAALRRDRRTAVRGGDAGGGGEADGYEPLSLQV
jgi:tetratricopeptide (TPR) repeat protein